MALWKQAEIEVTLSQIKEHLSSPETGRKKNSPLGSSEGMLPTDSLIWDFWPPELGDNKFLIL